MEMQIGNNIVFEKCILSVILQIYLVMMVV